MQSKPLISVCVFTTCYPRSANDEAAVFIKNYIRGLDQAGGAGLLLVPKDHSEPEQEGQGNFKIIRFRYGILCKGSLAFGSGIMPNIKQRPLLALQAPALLLSFALHALKRRSEFSVIHCNWTITALPRLHCICAHSKTVYNYSPG